MVFETFYKNGIAVIGILLISVSVCHAEVSKQDLVNVERQVQIQKKEQRKLEKAAEKASSDLKKINQEMIKAAKMIQDSEENLSLMEERLVQLEGDYDKTLKSLQNQDENLVKIISALQSLALKPTEALFVQPLSPVDIVRSAMLLRETVPYLEAQAEIIKQELEVLDSKKEAVKRQVNRIVAQKGMLEREHAQMKVLAEKKAKYKTEVSEQSVKAKREIKKLASQAQDIKDLLVKIEKERAEKARIAEEKRRQLAEEAKKKILLSTKSEQHKTADLIKSDADIINETGDKFIRAKGSLSWPARGKLISKYGQEMSKGVSSKGLTIETRNYAQVIAPFDGSVLFAGPFRGYGNIIIIEHGKGYTSLLAGLESIDCEVGQLLLAGEPVGQMPVEGVAKLYIELRKDNHPINPEPWIEK